MTNTVSMFHAGTTSVFEIDCNCTIWNSLQN